MRLPVWVRRRASVPIRNIRIRLRRGPNQGLKWSLAASGRGTYAGRYEVERFNAIASLVRPDEEFWDIGAHYGYATLIAAGLVGQHGSVTAFEPSSANLWYLRRHLHWNDHGRVRVIPCAVADSDRTDLFGGKGSSVSFRLGDGRERVEVRSISSLIESGLSFPTFVKIDVEGSESLVLEGAREALARARATTELPTMLVSVHDEASYRWCMTFLESLDYVVVPSVGILRRAPGARWFGDPDLLAVPPNRRTDLPTFGRIPWFSSVTSRQVRGGGNVQRTEAEDE